MPSGREDLDREIEHLKREAERRRMKAAREAARLPEPPSRLLSADDVLRKQMGDEGFTAMIAQAEWELKHPAKAADDPGLML